MKVGILYICTGKYSIFWKGFYESAEALFLPGYEKEYFVFTDAPQIDYEKNTNVHRFFQERQDWPLPTLLRFHMFLRAEKQLEEMDYVFFFNANMKVVTRITSEDILPDADKEDGLTVVLHSGYYKANSSQFPYERQQKNSLAYLEQGQHYYQGCLNGGSKDAYLRLVRRLKENVQADLDHDIVAVWHDESHLNKYMADKHPKILSPAFAYSEGQRFEFEPRILMLDKTKLGGHKHLRGQKQSLLEKLRMAVKKLGK